jgi:hypothetical protein
MTKQGGSLIRKVKLMGAIVAALSAFAIVLPATSDASISCGGRTALGDSGIGDNDVQYKFGCSEKINGFGIVVNTAVDIFSESANAFDPTTGLQIDKQSFECTGNIPGVGVACSGGKTGFAAGGTRVQGNLGLSQKPCRPDFRLRAWLVVSDATGAVSGPFQLGGPKECQAKRASRKSKRTRRSRR